MELIIYIKAIILGLIEGLTEFLPVSSTGHLIFFGHIMDFSAVKGFVFEVAIQLGAILAICFKYNARLRAVTLGITQRSNQLFALKLLTAFMPAAILGLLFADYIKAALFDPLVVAINLIIGGVIIILVERYLHASDKIDNIDDISLLKSLQIGCCQALALIPGTSRSGATIIGSRFLGLSRRAATEFSFFLAIPTMLAATLYDLYKNWDMLNADSLGIIALGFVVAFASSLFIVNRVIDFISTHGFAPFGWYRIAMGCIMVIVLW